MSASQQFPPGHSGQPADELILEEPLDISAQSAPAKDDPVVQEQQPLRENSAAANNPALPEMMPSSTTELEYETSTPLTEKQAAAFDTSVTLAIQPDTPARVKAVVDGLPSMEHERTKGANDWVGTLDRALYSMSYRGVFNSVFGREGSQWRQAVQSEQGPLMAARPKFKETGAEIVSGPKAVLRMRDFMNMGSIQQVPLWHSGFWVTLSCPTEAMLLDLYHQLSSERVMLGRQTLGLAHSNNSVVYNDVLLDWIVSHIYESTLKQELKDEIRKYIKQQDIPILIWGMACAIWPNGFPFVQPLLDPSGEKFVDHREMLNLTKLLFVNTRDLAPGQVKHMAQRRSPSMSIESLQLYQQQFTRGGDRVVELKEGLKLTLSVPTAAEYLKVGNGWINDTVGMVDKMLGETEKFDQRSAMINDAGRATQFRTYAHWVTKIEFGTKVAEDRETIDLMLEALSSDDDIRGPYFREILKYIEDCTIAVVGVPALPDSDDPEKVKRLKKFPNILVLDPPSVFFLLLVQKVQLVQSRQ